MGNALSKIVCDFWLYQVTFSGFQVLRTDLRPMTKQGNSVKPNLSPHNTKGYFITCTILEALQYYHGYVASKYKWKKLHDL